MGRRDEDEDVEVEAGEGEESGESSDAETGESKKHDKPKDFWDKLQSVSGLISGSLLAIVGFVLTGSVNQTIQKSQLQFNYVKEMEELLAKLGDPKVSLEEAKTMAVALGAFGSYSIPPLLNEIQSGELNRPAAGETGLRSVALADPKNTCPALARILENRTGAYNWFSHRAAIRILGTAGCLDQEPVLIRYQKKLTAAAGSAEAFEGFKEMLADEPVVTKETIDQLKSEIEKTLKLLERVRVKD